MVGKSVDTQFSMTRSTLAVLMGYPAPVYQFKEQAVVAEEASRLGFDSVLDFSSSPFRQKQPPQKPRRLITANGVEVDINAHPTLPITLRLGESIGQV